MALKVCIVVGAFFATSFATTCPAQERRAADAVIAAADEFGELRAILKAGRHNDSLPAGVWIRVESDLSKSTPAEVARAAKAEPKGQGTSKPLREVWEFTASQIHRVVIETAKDQAGRTKVVYRRSESKPLAAKGVCRDLLDADVFALFDGQGGGSVHFAGTDYDLGSRSITIFVNDREMLNVGESCAVAGFTQRDAEAFAGLYEKLATRARSAFAK